MKQRYYINILFYSMNSDKHQYLLLSETINKSASLVYGIWLFYGLG